MLEYKVAFDPFEHGFMRAVFYSVSWALKLLAYLLLSSVIHKGSVKKWHAYFIGISQKVHNVAMNVVALDLIPYSLRALFQAQNLQPGTVASSAILLCLLVFDFYEVYLKGSRAQLRDDPAETSQTANDHNSDLTNSKADLS